MKLEKLGNGSQAEVHKVVDLHNGNHYACKIVIVKTEIPGLRIYSEPDFRLRIGKGASLVQEMKHVSFGQSRTGLRCVCHTYTPPSVSG